MRAIVQRVDQAQVIAQDRIVGKIGAGMLVFVAVGRDDGPADLEFIRRKLINLRIFEDREGRMNLSLRDVEGQMLLVSQFTLFGDCRKGNRPSFVAAAPPEQALEMYNRLVDEIRGEGVQVETGEFQAMMKVSLVNDGPVTLMLDSRKNF